MAHTETVAFSCDIEQPTIHPEQSIILTFLGRAEIETVYDVDPFDQTKDVVFGYDVQITHLWLGIDVPSDFSPFHFRRVNTPEQTRDWCELDTKLREAAIDQLDNPQLVTLPDEVKPTLLENLIPAAVFGKHENQFAG